MMKKLTALFLGILIVMGACYRKFGKPDFTTGG